MQVEQAKQQVEQARLQPSGCKCPVCDQYVKAGGTLQTLAHWGLIIQKPNFEKKVRTSGLWMPTVKGKSFVKGDITVPSHVYLYNSKIQGFSEDEVTIREALGSKFSYEQLMSNAGFKQ